MIEPRHLGAALCVAAFMTAAHAHAAEASSARTSSGALSTRGNVIIGVERASSVGWSKVTVSNSSAEVTVSGPAVGLLWSGDPSTVYQAPRLAIDVTVSQALTVGGSIGYATSSGTMEQTPAGQATTKTDSTVETSFLLAPRVGYILDLGPSVSLWLRGGVTYWTASKDPRAATNNTVQTSSGFAATLDPQFVFSPASHFGLTAGLSADLPLGGSFKQETGNVSTNLDAKVTSVGATFGVLGWF